ncbi:MAG: tandem-95 repeat protein [Sedimentisphaerales bacterium]|nr:tandem-95 repeat protein [Sedimentisphaerales bacterium]
MKRARIIGALLVILVVGFLTSCEGKKDNPPVATDENISTKEDTPVSITLKGSDPEGNVLTFTKLADPAHGKLSGTEPNLVYTPNENFSGVDSFSFKVNDGVFDSNSAFISITITPENDPPVAQDDFIEIKEDTEMISINVLENDTDIDGDQLALLGAAEGRSGSIIISSDNKTIIYTPTKNFSGSDNFTYTVSDSKGGTDTGSVRIQVIGVNDPPYIRSKTDVSLIRVGSKFSYDVNARDADTDQTLTYSLITKPEGMTINSSTGLIEWEPKEEQVGTYDVEVKVEDSSDERASDTQEFTLNLTSQNSPISQVLPVIACLEIKSKKMLSSEDITTLLKDSDEKYYEIGGGELLTFAFSDLSVPSGAVLSSVILCIEHFEDNGFTVGDLQWNIGTGWPDNPDTWNSISAPVHEGQTNKSADSWEIKGNVDTIEKINSFELQIKNISNISLRKTTIDNICVIVKWY